MIIYEEYIVKVVCKDVCVCLIGLDNFPCNKDSVEFHLYDFFKIQIALHIFVCCYIPNPIIMYPS